MDKVSMILPADSYLILNDKRIQVDIFRMKKNHMQKNFQVQLFQNNQVIQEYKFQKMTIKIKEINEQIIFNITDGRKAVIIEARKILETKDLKRYIKTMII
ncbi:MAG: hypothetical protein ACK5HR_04925 [Mycoplasmatales bacterium]